MDGTASELGTAGFAVSNVGGIDETSVEIPPGVTILAGKNATNRTSFLQSIMAAMGSRRATLKGDAEAGEVELELGGETYTRSLSRTPEGVRFDGEGYLEDPAVADLFAFLLETNEARQAVATGGDLLELVMRPVDVEELTRQIEALKDRKSEINDELAEIESLKADLPELERRRTDLREEIEANRQALAEKEEEIADSDRDLDATREDRDRLTETLETLSETRADLEEVRAQIEMHEESVASLEDERGDLEATIEEFPDDPASDADLEARIEGLREEKRELDAEISDLQSVIQFNEETLEEAASGGVPIGETDGASGAPTDQLLAEPPSEVTCWTCGTTVDRSAIEDTLGQLRELRSEKVDAVSTIEDDLEELQQERRELERRRSNRAETESALEEVTAEIDRREATIEELEAKREDLQAEIADLQDTVDDLESAEFGDVLDLHREANELEFEIESLEDDLAEVTDRIESIEADLDRADDLRDERADIVSELTDKRTRIDQIEAGAVDAFNEHMDAILDVLGYDNIDRVWIERIERTVQEGNAKVDQTAFELHIVRTTESGRAYEDTVDHLSESEREVVGLVFALAGYLVHDLHETVPFMLLDSLEAIDSERIAALVEYFEEFAEYLVIALLPEDERALSEQYNRVREI